MATLMLETVVGLCEEVGMLMQTAPAAGDHRSGRRRALLGILAA
jgi:hypothetical protein